jgi:bacillithiol system protein YtxJ
MLKDEDMPEEPMPEYDGANSEEACGLERPSTQGTARFVGVRDVSELDHVVARSHDAPVILFQHDPYCPVSARAYRELSGAPIEAALVDVAHDQPVSRSIEERTGVRHESPQVLVVRDGQVVWSASHRAITRRAVTAALRDPAAPPDDGAAAPSRGLLPGLRAVWDRL